MNKLRRSIESNSSLTTFIECPYKYYQAYILKRTSETTRKVQDGQWIHQQLEKWVNDEYEPHEESDEYINALKDWLDQTGITIQAAEETYHFLVADKYKYQMKADAVTDNFVIDFKVTAAPAYYSWVQSYQARLYSYGMRILGTPKQFVYLLFERNKTTLGFKQLHVFHSNLTDIGFMETEIFIEQWEALRASCYENNNFPPSLNGCGSCFYKKTCEFYEGR